MTTASASVLSLADQVLARLRTLAPLVTVYDGEIVDDDVNPTSPPADDDGRVHAYAVLYPAAGWAQSVTLDQVPDLLDWSFQVTCVGGDRTRALWCVGRVRSVLEGWTLTDAAGQSALVGEASDPGPVRRDDDVKPSRSYTPLLFRSLV